MAKSILLDMLPFQHSGGFGGALSFTKAVYDCLFKHKNLMGIDIFTNKVLFEVLYVFVYLL
mgnify:CR=1 FL=1